MFPHYSAKNVFFADLFGKSFTIPDFAYIPLFVIDGILIWFISKRIYKQFQAFPLIVFLLSPWFYYLAIAKSYYFALLTPVLVFLYGFIIIEKKHSSFGSWIVAVGSALGAYFSPLLLLTLPEIMFVKKSLKALSLFILLTIPLFVMILTNFKGFKNSLYNETLIFTDPGIINTSNRFQGAAEKNGVKILARISENKYLFYLEYFSIKFVNQFMPVTVFSPEYKLLGFSFSPPILLGFIIPFVYGLTNLLLKTKLRKYLLISTLLALPALFTKEVVSLNRLILMSPIFIFVTSFGLAAIFNNKSGLTRKILILITAILLSTQSILIFSDIKGREERRFQSYNPTSYTLKEP